MTSTDADGPSRPATAPSQDSARTPNLTTPKPKSTEGTTSPTNAPAAARYRTNSRPGEQPPPTLLVDFLRGRPSPARLAAQRQMAQRQRRASVDAVRAEIRHEMHQASVRRIQQPGGVKERVKAWQKANAAAMAKGDPAVPPTEPSDVAFKDDDKSVTEDDRIRIKLRKRSATAPKEPSQKSTTLSGSSGSQPETAETPQTITPRRKTPPKKRVISDDHWVDKKNKKAPSPPRPSTTPKRKSQPNPMPLPKNFVQKTSWTPPASHKVRAWAKEIENLPPEDGPGGVRQLARASKSGDFDEDVDSLIYNDSTPACSQRSSFMRSSKPNKPAKSEADVDDDGIRVAAIIEEKEKKKKKKEKAAGVDGESPSVPPDMTAPHDDGIRVAAIIEEKEKKKKKNEKAADVDRESPSVAPDMTAPHDDGIRVAPITEKEKEKKKDKAVDAEKSPPSVPSDTTGLNDKTRPTSAPAAEKESSRKCSHRKPRKPSRPAPSAASLSFYDVSPYDFVYDRDGKSNEPIHEPETPTRRGTSKSKPKLGHRSRASAPTEITATTQTTETTLITESTEASGMTEDESKFTMRGARSPGGTSLDTSREPDEPTEGASLAEIPFGKSAFSEVDLPLGADARNSSTKQKSQRNGSFSAAKVLKRVVSEGRKMIHETVDPPKPAANNPPSIENWLTQTVDPFVDAPLPSEPALNPAQTRKSVEQKWAEESEARQPDREPTPKKGDKETTPRKTPRQKSPSSPESSGEDLTPKASREEPKIVKDVERSPEPQKKTPPSAGLKRKGARRANASPVKTSSGKSFRDAFKDAFKGQSANQLFNQTSYESREERTYEADPLEDEYYDDRHPSRRSWGSGSHQRSHTPDSYDSRDFDDDWTESSFTASSLTGPRRRPPPTNGVHELSTIASEVSISSYGDTMSTHSDLSETTVTQTTALTRQSEVRRQSSRKSGSGLKRRLTKHSDLVSVLSAPTNASVPYRVRSSRSRASVRRTRSKKQHSVTIDDLMQEFDDDENLYNRELKTLVDGVIPVLLNHAVSESADVLSVFGTNSPGRKVDAMSKAVVGMGISLEKLRNAHRRAPLDDVHALVSWLQGVVPIYSGYFNAWRMGFENLVVNLAPVEDVADDNDSLLNALPRNADGDIVNEDGERVDVAHLLKRPIYRVRMMTSFIKGAHAILGMDSTKTLVQSFEALQDHARRRHKEERARATDEDAANTDTTRTRDLRTLAPLDYIRIDPNLQVNAKDHFTLSISHSNGQRMECQVELVHRDKPSDPNHPGDLLIRQTGDSQRTWLLFPPMPLTLLSARRGDMPHEMVVMVRGTHNGKQWRELIWLSTDDELQVGDWLDFLGTDPVPPLATDIKAATPEPGLPRQLDDVPVGERSVVGSVPSPDRAPSSPPASPAASLPSRYRPQSRNQSPVPDKEPMEERYGSEISGSEVSQPDVPQIEIVEPEPSAPNTKPYREDGAPPPPVHRSFPSKKKAPLLLPPTDTRVKRRGSSPLKHEYLPSEGSDSEFTGESGSETETESGDESESDEIDSIDIPDTEIGFSIIKEEDEEDEEEQTPEETWAATPDRAPPPPPVVPDVAQSAVSEDSISPSNSASQVGVGARKPDVSQPTLKFVCSVSHWSDKRGTWKDLSKEPCAVTVSAGKMEVFSMKAADGDPPLVALDLTPLVLIRKSNAVDFEVRTALMEHSKLQSMGGGTFRFRSGTQEECLGLYGAVHDARLKNEKYIRLENEARFRSFGERRAPIDGDEGSGSSRRRSWFGRKNSYRASARAPARSAEDASTTPSSASASSFLRRLAAGANMTFNIGRSSVEKQGSRAGSFSFHTSSGSSAEGSMPRSPSLSIGEGSRVGPISPDNVPIRLHLLVSPSKWEDYGNCRLQVRRPPEGWRQELRADHGLEKRVTVSTIPKKDSEPATVILDAVLGSGCFRSMGTRGIVCSVWEEMRDEYGRAGAIPQTSSPGGSVKKWCFQVGGVGNAGWLLALLHEEVVRA